MRVGRAAWAIVVFAACVRAERSEPAVTAAHASFAAPPEPIDVAPPPVAPSAEVTFGTWTGFGTPGCAYLAPKTRRGGVRPDGGVDVVFHFHAGQMSDRDLRASRLDAVIVSCGWGMGTTPYARAFADPNRFDRMLRAVTRKVGGSHVRKLALVSWSAGYASIAKILGVPRHYAKTDAVVLLDSLHAPYDRAKSADVRKLDVFVRFARDAARGDKAMVITHSAIVPPGYASSTEATRALLTAIEVPIGPAPAPSDAERTRGMRPLYHVDVGDLHVRGFRGAGPDDHFDHLHLVGEVLRNWVVVRWRTDRPLVYTEGGEQH